MARLKCFRSWDFYSVRALQHQMSTKNIDELVTPVETAIELEKLDEMMKIL